jgi:hypothetical protein
MLGLVENRFPLKIDAFFDLDKTVITKSSTLTFSKLFYQGGLINCRAVLRTAYARFVFLAGVPTSSRSRRSSPRPCTTTSTRSSTTRPSHLSRSTTPRAAIRADRAASRRRPGRRHSYGGRRGLPIHGRSGVLRIRPTKAEAVREPAESAVWTWSAATRTATPSPMCRCWSRLAVRTPSIRTGHWTGVERNQRPARPRTSEGITFNAPGPSGS